MKLNPEQFANLEGEIVRDIEEFTGCTEGDAKLEWLTARSIFFMVVDKSTNMELVDLFRKHSCHDLWDGSTSALQFWKYEVVDTELRKRLG
jgi:hypothetical protein